MKTVMKKMFSLLLVAVLLVGAMPMAAFADGTAENYAFWFELHIGDQDYTGECIEVAPGTAFTNEQILNYAKSFWPEAFPENYTYEIGGDTVADKDNNGADIFVTPVIACEHCDSTAHDSVDCITLCDKNNACDAVTHYEDCPKHPDYTPPVANATVKVQINNGTYAGSFEIAAGKNAADVFNAFKASSLAALYADAHGPIVTLDDMTTALSVTEGGKTYYLWLTWNEPEDEPTPDPETKPEKCGTCESTEHTTANCPYCDVCWDNGDKVVTHKTSDHCRICGKTDGTHKQGYSCYKSTGNSTVKVHVRLYTSNVHTKTVELLTYKDSSDARIYSSVAKHDDLIRAELAKQYPGYSWSGNLYDNPSELEDTKETIGKGTTVYINAYTDQDLVYIYVHNSRSMSNLRIIQLEGKQVGETVTKSEVTKAVSKYFSVNNLSMYSEQAWEDYVDGESVESVSSLKVTSDPYFIDVKISGSAKSTSGSGSTADSTNPKTGDAIFAPAMILGLSASALVVLYYLNKKRAF